MPVIINLREVFATDSQVEVSAKVNFNFNQLLELGLGQVGPVGPQGPTGAAGPVGPIGPQGPEGTVIFSNSSTTSSTPGVVPPNGMTVGDILITADKIWKKNSTNWTQVSDFNQLVINALGVNISPYIIIAPNSRVLKPRITSGLDLTNSLTTTDPNYATPGLGQNYQTVLYNFNELNAKSVVLNNTGSIVINQNSSTARSFSPISGGAVDLTSNEITFGAAHGFSTGTYVTYSAEGGSPISPLSNFTGYYVIAVTGTVLKLAQSYSDALAGTAIDLSGFGTGSLHRLITAAPEPDKVFPATANLLLYSYFNGTADQAKQFATTAKGYKHQLELGSLDTLTTGYPGVTSTAQAFVISPSFENLRFRKYRLIGPGSWTGDQGSYYLRSEYDLSSDGITSASSESFSPRRNSEQIWKINKAETLAANSRVIEMRLTNSNLLAWNESSSSTLVDGIFLKRGPSANDSNSYSFGLGFHPTNLSQVLFDSSNNITAFKYRGVQVEITRPSDELGTVITPTGIFNNTNEDFTISSQGSSKIQLTDTRLLERLDFGFDENQASVRIIPPGVPLFDSGAFLSENTSGNYRLTANKNVIRLGKDPFRLNTAINPIADNITIENITTADLGTVIYVIVGEADPTYRIQCSYPTPGISPVMQPLGQFPIVDRSYSSKNIPLIPNTIVKFTLVQRWFFYPLPIGPIAWKYWYMENLDAESVVHETQISSLQSRAQTLENPMTDWAPLTITNFNASGLIEYRKNIITSQVFFRGFADIFFGFPSGNNIIGILPNNSFPVNVRPSTIVRFPVHNDVNTPSRISKTSVSVSPNGEVRFTYEALAGTPTPTVVYRFFIDPVSFFTT
jgi:hypothetical protein